MLELGSFAFGYALQLVLGSVTIFILIDVLRFGVRAAFFINVAITAAFSFTFLDRLVFTTNPKIMAYGRKSAALKDVT